MKAELIPMTSLLTYLSTRLLDGDSGHAFCLKHFRSSSVHLPLENE